MFAVTLKDIANKLDDLECIMEDAEINNKKSHCI